MPTAGSDVPDHVLENGRQRHRAKRLRGIPVSRTDGSLTSEETDAAAAAAEWWAATELGQEYNDRVLGTGDGGVDFRVGLDVECIWLGQHQDGGARMTGHLIVNPHEPQRWADIYVVVRGLPDQGFEWSGWTSHRRLVQQPMRDFGYGPRYALHTRDLWRIETFKMLRRGA